MTNKTEDKFYFGKPGQPERFSSIMDEIASAEDAVYDGRDVAGVAIQELLAKMRRGLMTAEEKKYFLEVVREAKAYGMYSRPGQPERFAESLQAKWDGKQYRVLTPSGAAWYSDDGKRWTLKHGEPVPSSEVRKYDIKLGTGFSRPGQPERFGVDKDMMGTNKRIIRAGGHEFLAEDEGNRTRISIKIDGVWEHATTVNTDNQTATEWIEANVKRGHPSRWLPYAFSRPGQPERFGLEDACWEGYEPVGTKQKDGRTVPNCVPKDENAEPEEFAAEIVSSRGSKRAEIKRDATGKWAAVLIQSNRTGVPGEGADEQVLDMKWYATEANARSAAAKMLSARYGEKDKFDASSLDRGNSAEASQSPMLGKLLAAKVMPEGGWRAVQVGSDTLVISFEDADLASDFGRRVATKGYNATSPVQAIGRYWNVEVKNGK